MAQAVTLFKSKLLQQGQYKRVRIPCLLALQSGRLIACFEGRKGAGDWAKIDIIFCTSDDGGKSFSEFKVACSGNGLTLNNPCMVEDETGSIHLMYCKNYAVGDKGGVFVKTSTDNGDTFGVERDMSDVFASLGANVIAIGPAHGIMTAEKVLVFTVWYVSATDSTTRKSHHPAKVTTVYSKDNGVSWHIGESIPTTLSDINETAICNCNGGVMINSRVHGLGVRATAFSQNGYSDWSEHTKEVTLTDPTCQGSLTSDKDGNI